MEKNLDFLKKHNIEFALHKHEAVFTCDDAKKSWTEINGLECKNLFLKDKKSKNFFLVSLPITKRADLKKLALEFSINKLTFANENELMKKLALTPGSVSPFGLLNNSDADVEYYIDKDIADAEIVAFHPNINTATLDLKQEDFRKFLKVINRDVKVITSSEERCTNEVKFV